MLEDRVRAATQAIAGTVAPDSAPPLRLPAAPRPRRARRWAHSLTPAAAALAVTAVVLGSLALHRGDQAGLHPPVRCPAACRGITRRWFRNPAGRGGLRYGPR